MATGRLIIIGGGFAGVKCAKTLRKLVKPGEYEIVVFSRENHMVFYPLLAEVAAAAINPKDMAAPLRELLNNVLCRTEEVVSLDPANNQIFYEDADGNRKAMSYDHLVIANGNMTNLAFIPGMADHALPLKSVADALAIQDHVIGQLEKAEIADSDEKRKWCLHFVVVGGGFSGVEMAGELNDFVKSSARFYSSFKRRRVRYLSAQPRSDSSRSRSELARVCQTKNGAKRRQVFPQIKRRGLHPRRCRPQGRDRTQGRYHHLHYRRSCSAYDRATECGKGERTTGSGARYGPARS